MLDFPSSPTNGQNFVAANGGSWTWDGVKWVSGPPSAPIYLPLTGGTLTGNLAAPSLSAPDGTSAPLAKSSPPTGDNSLDLATTAWVATGASAVAHGFKNKFRNGTMDIWQRGTTFNVATGTTVFTADGWIVSANGATATVGVSSTPINATVRSMVITGAAGLTQCTIQQRIESYVAAPLVGKTVTVQFRIKNNSGVALTPQLATYYPTVNDNYAATNTDLIPTNLQTIPNGATAVVAYTLNVSASATTGYLIQLLFGGALNGAGNAVAITEADIRTTYGWPVGLCANPPSPELRHIQAETAFCQRYYQVGQLVMSGWAAASQAIYQSSMLPTLMRASPTIVPTAQNINNGTGLAAGPYGTFAVWMQITAGATAAAYVFSASYTASAEL